MNGLLINWLMLLSELFESLRKSPAANANFKITSYSMKKYLIYTAIVFYCFSLQAQVAKTGNARIEAIIKKMTLQEKVGQMTQVTLAVIAKGGGGNTDGSLDQAAVKKRLLIIK